MSRALLDSKHVWSRDEIIAPARIVPASEWDI